MRRNTAIAVLSGLLLVSPPLLGAVYKWVDENGTVHYSQVPPQSGPVEELNPTTGQPRIESGSLTERLKRQQEQREAAQEEQRQAAQEARTEADEQAARRRNCATARSNLSTLEAGGRFRYADADGNLRYLTDDERQERMAEARKQIEYFCDDD